MNEKITRIWFINLYLICISLPFCLPVNPLLVTFPILSLIIYIQNRKAYSLNSLWVPVIFFVVLTLGVFLSTADLAERFTSMDTQLPFLAFPLSFMVVDPKKIVANLNKIFFFYVLGAALASLHAIGHSFYCVLFLGEFKEIIISVESLDYYFGRLHHHTYFSLHAIIAMTFIIRLLFINYKGKGMRVILLVSWVLINLAVYIASSRAGLILALVINLYLFWRILQLIKFRWIKFSLPIILVGLLAVIMIRNDKLTYIWEGEDNILVNFWNKGGDGIREVIWQAALEEGWERFPIGQGTHRTKTVMMESRMAEYEANDIVRTPNAHNQYLEIFVENSLPGGILFFLMLYLLFQVGIQQRQKIVLAFLANFAFLFLIESVLKHPYGVPPFVFFYSIFMIAARQKKLPKKEKPILARVTTVPISMNILIKGQLAHLKETFRVFGITSPGKEVKEIEMREDIKVHTLKMNRSITPLRDLVAVLRMTALLFRQRPDIIHSQTPKAGLVGMLGARMAGISHRIHSVVGLPLQEQKGLKRTLVSWVDKLVYLNSTHVLINSHGLKDYMVSNNLVSEKKVGVLGNGTTNGINLDHYQDTDVILTEAQKIKKSLFGEEPVISFLYVGRIVKDKGLNELVQAFNKLSASSQKARLILVGRPESKNPVSKETQDIIHKNDSILSIGYQQDIRPYLSLADYFVFPTYREGFPNVVLQALAYNLPCIATDINGANEVIVDGKNGMLIPVKDSDALLKAMNEIINNQSLTKKAMKDNRPMLAEKFSQQFIWEQYTKFYQSL